MIRVVAIITAKPGQRQAILDELHARIEHVRAEPGCLEYVTTVDGNAEGLSHQPAALGPNTFLIIEKWRSTEDLAAHSHLPFVAEYIEKVGPMMASRVVHVLEPLA